MTRALIALFAPMLVSMAPLPSPSASSTLGSTPPASPPACQEPPPDTGGPALGAPSPAGGGNLMQPRLGGDLGFFEVSGAAPGPRSGHTAPLELTVAGPSRRTTTEPLELRVAVENRGAERAIALRALDGSLEHWRHPHWDLHARDESTGRVYRWDFHGGRCAMVNPVRDEDYVALPAGATRTDVPGPWADYLRRATLGAPGRYTVWVVYRFCGSAGSGLPLGPSVERGDVTEGVFASNGVVVEVRPAPPAATP